MDVNEHINKINQNALEIFHHLHRFPELSEEEKETADYICSVLSNHQIPFRRDIAGHGITAVVSGSETKCIGIRADIDALPVAEDSGLPYASERPGVMHACGHDMHTAILLGTGIVLKEMADAGELPGSVKLIFQPAEETIGGAHAMIDAGVLENPKVSAMLGLHVDPTCETGVITVKSGPMNAAVHDFFLQIQGRQTHGATPEDGVDPIVIAADIIMNLQNIASRLTSPLDSVVVTVGQVHSGTACNIIPDTVFIGGSVRALSSEMLEFVKKKTEDIAKSTASLYGASVEISWRGTAFPPLINSDRVSKLVEDAAADCPHIKTVRRLDKPSMGADDFAFFTEALPGAYFTLGCSEKNAQRYPLHSDKFVADENAVIVGIEAEVRSVLMLLSESFAL